MYLYCWTLKQPFTKRIITMKMSIDTEKFKASITRRKQMEDKWRVNYQNTEWYKGLQDARLGNMHINQNTCFWRIKSFIRLLLDPQYCYSPQNFKFIFSTSRTFLLYVKLKYRSHNYVFSIEGQVICCTLALK